MKNRNILWAYLIAIVAGVLLVAFHASSNVFEIIVIIIGVLFFVPSLLAAITTFFPGKEAKAQQKSVRWDVGLTAIGGIILGLLLICMPGFFVDYLIYTLSIVLIICGIMQIISISKSGEASVAGWLFIVPVLSVVAGIVMIIAGPQKIANAATIITGIFLICYGANGFIGYLCTRKGKKALPAE